ncbi:MAG: type secretion system family protein [Verrucomicrobia bacterium]|jgi:type II secretory pathway component PulF|nr:type secretion system family protein [Verrucomicrobiota bacterium]
MAQFAYRARKRTGEIVEGMLDVVDRPAALLQIQKLGLFPVAVTATKGGAAVAVKAPDGAAAPNAMVLPPGLQKFFNRKRKPKLEELARFTQQLANLLHCGMPLVSALNSMSSISTKGIPSSVAKQLRQEVIEGKSLSAAMAKQPEVFTDLYVNMVRAGEQSGALEEVLRRLSAHYERFAEVRTKFISALIYPAMVMCVGVVIIFFFMTFMLPKFMEIFTGMNVPLPAATQFLIKSSNLFSKWWWLMLLGAFTVYLLFHRYKKSASGRRTLDRWSMKAPVIGPVMKLNLFGQFCRTLATLLRNGVPVLNALKITEQVIPNVMLKEAIAITREEVTDGKTIAQPLAKSGLFPQLMLDLLKIGEETGDVPGSLENLADTYESELAIGLRVMTNLIEPIMIVCIAVFVGFLLYCVLGAMFAITSNIDMQK